MYCVKNPFVEGRKRGRIWMKVSQSAIEYSSVFLWWQKEAHQGLSNETPDNKSILCLSHSTHRPLIYLERVTRSFIILHVLVCRRDSPAVRWILLPKGWTLPSVQTHLKSLLIDWWCSSSSSAAAAIRTTTWRWRVIKLYKKEALNCKTWNLYNYIQFVLDSPVWAQTLPRLKTPKWSKIHFTNVFAQSYSSLCFSWTPQGREKFDFLVFAARFTSMQLSERFFLNTDNPWLLCLG